MISGIWLKALYYSRALFGYEGQTNDLKVVSKGGKAVILSGTGSYKFIFNNIEELIFIKLIAGSKW